MVYFMNYIFKSPKELCRFFLFSPPVMGNPQMTHLVFCEYCKKFTVFIYANSMVFKHHFSK